MEHYTEHPPDPPPYNNGMLGNRARTLALTPQGEAVARARRCGWRGDPETMEYVMIPGWLARGVLLTAADLWRNRHAGSGAFLSELVSNPPFDVQP